MTESVPSSTGDLENLVAEYVSGVENRQANDARTWLPVRDQIEAQWDSLTPEQAGRVEEADETLVENAGEVAARMAATEGGALRDLRAATPHSPEQWWWYLDVLSHVSDQIGAAPPTQPQPWYSQLVVIIEWVVIAVAVFVIVRNLIPSLAQQNTGASSAALPSSTPAPTETPDTTLFDMSTATTFKTPDGVIQMLMPKAWRFTPSTTPGNYQFAAGPDFAPTATIQAAIDDPKTLYQNFRITTPVNSPQEALAAIKGGVSPDANFQFGPIQAVKIGTLDGYGMTVSIPASAQGAAQNIELRFSPEPNGKMVFVEMQAAASDWPAAKDTMYKMVDSMVVTPGNIPTATPTSTPHPLELTATAIQHLVETNQAQINALTPTTTPAPTEAATGPATANALSGLTFTPAPTSTSAATAAATPAATAAK